MKKHLYVLCVAVVIITGCKKSPLSLYAHRTIYKSMEYIECPDTLVVTCKENKLHIDRLHYITSTHRDFLPVYQQKGDTLLISDSKSYFCFCLSEFRMEYQVSDLPFGRYLLVCGVLNIEEMDSSYRPFPPTYIDFQPDMQPVYIKAQEEELCTPLLIPMPNFPGGVEALFQFIAKNTQYPEQARKDSIQGHVICRFNVQADGSITDIEIVRSLGSPLLDEEAIRVLSSMPRWEWDREPGKYAPKEYIVPINFKLE